MSVDLPLHPLRPGLGGTLRPHQGVGVEFMVEHDRVIVGDQMGTGKTPQALAALHHLDAFPATVVVPASLGLNWLREAKLWLDGANIELIRSGSNVSQGTLRDVTSDPEARSVPRSQPEYALKGTLPDLTIVSYDLLPKHLDRLRRQRAVILDEAHYVKDPHAKRSRAVARLVESVPRIWPMSGSPIVNRPAELMPLLNILRCLHEFGGWGGFTERYCDRHAIVCPACRGRGWRKAGQLRVKCKSCRGSKTVYDYSGCSNLQELNELLRVERYIRRTRAEVLPELPGKLTPALVSVELTNRREYERAKRDLVLWLREVGEADRADRAQRAVGATRFAYLRRIAAVGKVKPSIAWIGDFLDGTGGDEKLVVFAHHHDLREPVAAAFPGCAQITGGDPEGADAEVQRFQTDPECRLMVASMEAGGLGHTLTAAAHVAILELPTTPKSLDQCQDRLDRIGQTKAVQPYHLVAEDSIDDDLAVLHAEKRRMFEQLVERGDVVGADRVQDTDLSTALLGRMG